MATRQSTVDFILEQIEQAGAVSARKMFGEYALYCDGRVVALVCDDQLYVKPTQAGQDFIGQVVQGHPYPGAKPYFLITGDWWDEPGWLAQLVRVSAAELPLVQKRPARKARKK